MKEWYFRYNTILDIYLEKPYSLNCHTELIPYRTDNKWNFGPEETGKKGCMFYRLIIPYIMYNVSYFTPPQYKNANIYLAK